MYAKNSLPGHENSAGEIYKKKKNRNITFDEWNAQFCL